MLLFETTLMGAGGAAVGENYLFTWGTGVYGQLGQYTSTGFPPNNYTTLSWASIDTGSHTVAIRSDSTLWTWGLNSNGQLGDGTLTTRGSPVQIGTSSWLAVSIGRSATYAVRVGGTLFAWGLNDSGQVGDGTTVSRSSPYQIGTSSWTTVSSMGDFASAIRQGGTLFAWGNNSNGQLGDGDSTGTYRSSPVQIGTSSWTAVNAGTATIAAVRQGGTLFVWGDGYGGKVPAGNTAGILSIGTASWTSVAFTVNAGAGIKDNRLFTWGLNQYGLLGAGSSNNNLTYSSPVQLGTSNWTQVTANSDGNFLALRQDGRIFGWGANFVGALGLGDLVARSSPTQIGTSSWVSLAYKSAGNANMWAIRQGGTLFGWGNNSQGQLGDETYVSRSSPVQIGNSSWNMVSAGYFHTLAIRQGGSLFLWGGSNAYGELGQSLGNIQQSWTFVSTWSTINSAAIRSDGRLFIGGTGWGASTYSQALAPVGTSSWTAVSIGPSHVLAIRQGGTLFAWGYQQHGVIGNGTSDTSAFYNSPVQIGASSWTAVSANRSFSSAIRSDGALFTWGGPGTETTNVPLGSGDNVSRSSPVQVGTSLWSAISTGAGHALAIRQGGSLFTWGRNNAGQLGFYDSSGNQIYGLDSWSAIGIGDSFSMGIRGQRLYGWGQGQYLGANTYAVQLSPIVIGSQLWSSLSVGPSSTAGITTTGGLYVWGRFEDGLTGNGSSASAEYLTPVQIGTSSWSQVAMGRAINGSGHMLAVRQGGTLFAWGRNNFGQLGNGTLESRSSPVQIGTSSWTAIAAGRSFSMAIRQDGRLFTWGNNEQGQLGNYDSSGTPSVFESWISVSAGQNHTLAIKPDGKVYAWGNNNYGELGDGTYNQSSSPVAVLLNTSVTAVSAGWYFSYALGLDKKLYFWGMNAEGQRGNGTQSPFSYSPTPVQAFTSLANNDSWTAVTAGQGQVWAIRQDGQMWGVGANDTGNYPNYLWAVLGDGTRITRSSPVQIGAGVSWSQVAAAQSHAMALSTTGRLYTWGGNDQGQLGIYDSSGTLIDSVQSSWLQVVGGEYHTNAIDSQGKLYGWGFNYFHAAGLPSNFTQYSYPTLISSFSGGTPGSFTQVASGVKTGMAIADNNLYGWGDDTNYQIGLNGSTVSLPTVVRNGVTRIAMGQSHSLAIGTDASLSTTGRNDGGQCGNGNNFSPTYGWSQISGPSWTAVGAGSQHSLAITSTGTLYTWGFGSQGALGNSSLFDRSSPVQIGSSSWTAVAGAVETSMAIRRGGSLFTWGYNFHGQLGDGTRVSKSSPVLIGSSSWTAVSQGSQIYNFYAIRQDGRLFGWGENNYGQLGQGDLVSRSSPTQIGSSSWTFVGTGQYNVGAVRSGNLALMMWGYDQYNQLGGGSVASKSSPVFVGVALPALNPLPIGNSSWTAIAAGQLYSMAVRQGGTLFTWGVNTYGELGLGDTIFRSSPIQVGTSSWTGVSSGGRTSYAIRQGGNGFGWGYNQQGQIGDGTSNDASSGGRSSPVAIAGGSTNYALISGSRWNYGFAVAKGNTGGVFTWGQQGPQLGRSNGTNQSLPGLVGSTNVSSPVQIGTSSWTVIAADTQSAAAIRQGGTLFTWGDNLYGQLGTNNITSYSSPVQIGTSSWSAVSMYESTTVAVRNLGTMFTWGRNNSFRLGTNDYSSRSSPAQVAGSAANLSFSVVSMGGRNAAGIQSVAGQLWVWGSYFLGTGDYNDSGQPIRLPQGQTLSPVQIGTSSWQIVAAGSNISMAIRQGGTFFAWGAGGYGSLGDGDNQNRSSPMQIGSSSWIAVGPYGTNAGSGITQGNTLFTWGWNFGGSLADGTQIDRSSPAAVGGGVQYTSIIRNPVGDGNWMGWVQNNSLAYYAGYPPFVFQNPLGPTEWRSSPTLIYAPPPTNSPLQLGTSSWSLVGGGFFHSVATSGSNTFAWGQNNFGQLGDNTTINRSSPVLAFSQTLTDLAVWQYGWLGVWSAANQVYLTGYNPYGNIGDGTTNNRSAPFGIGGPQALRLVAQGLNTYQPALVSDTGLWFMGINTWTRGTGYQTFRSSPTFLAWSSFSSPVQIGSLSYTAVSMGRDSGIALRNTGAIFTWGSNQYGQIGNGSSLLQPAVSPVQVGTSSWTQVSAGRYNVTALRQDGTAWVWGLAIGGEGYEAGTQYRSSPVAVVSSQIANSWTAVRSLRGDNNVGGVGININATPQQLAWFWGTGGWAMGQGYDSFTVNTPVVLYNNAFSSPTQVGEGRAWSQTAQGDQYGLALFGSSLYGWGQNNNGQLGTGDRQSRSSPTQIGASAWSSVSAKGVFAHAIRQNGTLFGWGLNNNGSVGDGTSIDRSSPVQIGASSWSAVSSGQSHAMAIGSQGTLWAWGFNSSGEVGDGTRITRSSPVQLGTSSWQAVAAGLQFSLAIRQGGTLWAWGLNTNGQLGTPFTANTVASPVQLGASSWTAIAAGRSHALAIRSDGKLFGWGRNDRGVLAQSLVAIAFSRYYKGASTAYGIDTLGRLWSMGLNSSGLLGQNLDPTTLNTQIWPGQIGTSSWTAVNLNPQGTAFALRQGGTLFAWGYGQFGPVGDGTNINRSSPVQIGTSSWIAIATDNNSVYKGAAIRQDGRLFTWGYNPFGELGDGTIVNRSSPVQIGTSSWVSVAYGGYHGIAIRQGGTLFAWGYNPRGNIGDGTTETRSSPVQIGTSSWVAVTGGSGYSTWAIRQGGTLFAWGENANGELGLGDTITRSSPTQMGTSSWTAITAAGNTSVWALRQDGTLWAWGLNTSSQLGDLTAINRSSPVQINIGLSFTAIGQYGAVTTAQVPYGWFSLQNMGNGSQSGTINPSPAMIALDNSILVSPTQIGNSSWTAVSAGFMTSAALDVNQYLWTWGAGNLLVLGGPGGGTTVDRSSPVQVGGNTAWSTISLGYSGASAVSENLP